jgi:transposase
MNGSAFRAYYARLIARGMRKREALMTVMRKMLIVAVHLLKTGEVYDRSLVSVAPAS